MDRGVDAEASDIDQLFSSLDADGGGSLDLNEIKGTFKKLVDAHTNAQNELKDVSGRNAAGNLSHTNLGPPSRVLVLLLPARRERRYH